MNEPTGFGFSFYGFFGLAAVWLAAYFVWSFRTARRERDRHGAGRDPRRS